MQPDMDRVMREQADCRRQTEALAASIIRLSNTGASLIERGHYQQAIGHLSTALLWYKTSVDEETVPVSAIQSQLGCHQQHEHLPSFDDGAFPRLVDIDDFMDRRATACRAPRVDVNSGRGPGNVPRKGSAELASKDAPKISEDVFDVLSDAAISAVYRSPIYMPEWVADGSFATCHTSTFDNHRRRHLCPSKSIAVVVLFNMALAHHLMVLSQYARKHNDGRAIAHANGKQLIANNKKPDAGDASSNTVFTLADKAVKLYNLTFELMESDQDDYDDAYYNPVNRPQNGFAGQTIRSRSGGYRTRCILLTMTIMNNLGLVHRVLGDNNQSTATLERVQAILMLVADDYRRNGGGVNDHHPNDVPSSLLANPAFRAATPWSNRQSHLGSSPVVAAFFGTVSDSMAGHGRRTAPAA